MPSVSKNQQKFMGIVRSIQKGEQPAGKFSKDAQKAAKKMKKSSVKKYAKTKHDDLPMKKESKTSDMMKAVRKGGTSGPWDIIISKNNKIVKRVSVKNLKEIPAEMGDVKKAFPNHKIGIEAKSGKIVYREGRDYKDEYKKFQSSTKAKKYRAELNKYNRKKGTYGNGDGKDASHKGGKIVGFESQSKNRGRAEKSRLKKEAKTTSIEAEELMNFLMKRFKFNKKKAIDTMKKAGFNTSMLKKEDIRQEIEEYVDGILDGMGEEFMVNEEKECMCEACQKGYMTHPTRKTKEMFGKRYRNCVKKEGKVDERKFNHKKVGDDYMGGLNSPKGDTEMFADKKGKYYIWVKEKGKKAKYVDLPKNVKSRSKADDFHRKIQKKMNEEWTVNIKLKEGTCGYGIDGQLGNEPAGPHLLKKKKKKKDEVSLGGRMSKKISKHRGTRNSADAKKVEKLLLKYGNTKKDVADMMKKYDYVSKTYRRATPAKKAEILSSLREAVKLRGKSKGTISHVGMPPASKGVEKLFKIADGGFGKVGGQTVDSMSANLFKQIYDKASDDIKLKLNKKNEKQLVMIISKMWNKFGKNVSIGSSI